MSEKHIPPAAKSIKQFAASWSISVPTVYREIWRGNLQATKIGRKTIITLEAEEAWWGTHGKVDPKPDHGCDHAAAD